MLRNLHSNYLIIAFSRSFTFSAEISAEPSESGISVDTEASSADSADKATSPSQRHPAAALAPPGESRNDAELEALQAQLSLAEEEKQRINNVSWYFIKITGIRNLCDTD